MGSAYRELGARRVCNGGIEVFVDVVNLWKTERLQPIDHGPAAEVRIPYLERRARLDRRLAWRQLAGDVLKKRPYMRVSQRRRLAVVRAGDVERPCTRQGSHRSSHWQSFRDVTLLTNPAVRRVP